MAKAIEKTTKRIRCPHCGNIDRSLMQDNGEPEGCEDLTLLCVKPCRPADNSFAGADPAPYCGMQWEPFGD